MSVSVSLSVSVSVSVSVSLSVSVRLSASVSVGKLITSWQPTTSGNFYGLKTLQIATTARVYFSPLFLLDFTFLFFFYRNSLSVHTVLTLPAYAPTFFNYLGRAVLDKIVSAFK